MVIDHRPDGGALNRADPALTPVGQALLADLESIGHALGVAELRCKKVEGFTVRHEVETKHSVEFVNGPFRCGVLN